MNFKFLLITAMLTQSTTGLAEAGKSNRRSVQQAGVMAFPMTTAMFAAQPGNYQQYNLSEVQIALLKYYQDANDQDVQYVLSSMREVNEKLVLMSQLILGDKGFNAQFKIKNLAEPVDYKSFFLAANEINKAKADLEILAGGLAAVPSMTMGKETTAQASGNIIQIPNRLKTLDMSPLVNHVKARVDSLLGDINKVTYKLKTPRGIISVDGIELKIAAGEQWDAKIYEDMQLEAKRLTVPTVTEKAAINNFNILGRNLMQGLLTSHGTDKSTLGNYWNLNKEGQEKWVSEIAQYFFVRSRLRLQYGVRQGTPVIAGIKEKNFYLHLFNGVKALQFSSSEFVTKDDDLRTISNNIFNQLLNAETQSKIGGGLLTAKNAKVLSAISVFNWARATVTGVIPTARMNAIILTFLYLDIQEELTAETLGGNRALKEMFVGRYKIGRTPEEVSQFKIWNCSISKMIDESSSCGQAAAQTQGGDDSLFEDDSMMNSGDSLLTLIGDAVRLGFKPKLARVEQAKEIVRSADKIFGETEGFKKSKAKSNAIDGLL